MTYTAIYYLSHKQLKTTNKTMKKYEDKITALHGPYMDTAYGQASTHPRSNLRRSAELLMQSNGLLYCYAVEGAHRQHKTEGSTWYLYPGACSEDLKARSPRRVLSFQLI